MENEKNSIETQDGQDQGQDPDLATATAAPTQSDCVDFDPELEPQPESMDETDENDQKPLLPIVPKRIAVLSPGWSVEQEISISTGVRSYAALQSLGHIVVMIDPKPQLEEFIHQLKTCFPSPEDAAVGELCYPDLVFNGLHGTWGESGQCQAILETLGIPYTHSNTLASAAAMNKRMTRNIAQSVEVRVPFGAVMSIESYRQEGFPVYPHLLKPIDSGSSYGIILVKRAEDVQEAAGLWDFRFGTEMLVEEFIPGRELSCAVFAGQARGVCEIVFDTEIFDVTCKYIKGECQTLVPAPIHRDIYNQAMHWSEVLYSELQCSGVVRLDFRYNDAEGEPGQLYLLEANTQPGLTPTSLIAAIMELHGWSFNDVIQWIVNDALERSSQNSLRNMLHF